jgi:hypothetical protein
MKTRRPRHMPVFGNAAPGCRSVWYRPRHELGGQGLDRRSRVCWWIAWVSVGALQAGPS